MVRVLLLILLFILFVKLYRKLSEVFKIAEKGSRKHEQWKQSDQEKSPDSFTDNPVKKEKVFKKNEGEYIDFEEIKEDKQ